MVSKLPRQGAVNRKVGCKSNQIKRRKTLRGLSEHQLAMLVNDTTDSLSDSELDSELEWALRYVPEIGTPVAWLWLADLSSTHAKRLRVKISEASKGI